MSALNQLYADFKDRVTFYVVYIREAHPADGRRPDREVEVPEPTRFEERLGVAKTCQADLGLKLPMLVDDLKNEVDKSYAAWPDRLFLVGTDGKVAYRGAPGPRGFQPAELRAAIVALLKAKPTDGPPAEEADLDAVRERLKRARKKSLGED